MLLFLFSDDDILSPNIMKFGQREIFYHHRLIDEKRKRGRRRGEQEERED